jgi:hypothetical protein
MDESLKQTGDEPEPDALWSEAIWGLGLIGAVVAIVAIIAAFGA